LEGSAFQNVKDQIGFCGIWCGSCAAGNGALIELTKKFEEVVKNYNLERWVPKGFDFREFTKGLALIQTTPLCPGCKKGGGNPTCKVRVCASAKGMTNCSHCDQLTECRNFEQLEKSRPKIKQDLREIKDAEPEELVEKWISKLKAKWPHCILACDSTKN